MGKKHNPQLNYPQPVDKESKNDNNGVGKKESQGTDPNKKKREGIKKRKRKGATDESNREENGDPQLDHPKAVVKELVDGDIPDSKREGQNPEPKKKKNKKSKKRKRKEVNDEIIGEDTAVNTKSSVSRRQRSDQKAARPDEQARASVNDNNINAIEDVESNGQKSKKKKKKKKRRKDRQKKHSRKSADDDAASVELDETAKAKEEGQEDGKPEVSFPFPTDPDDHCESPRQAYAHIQPLLQYLQSNRSNKSSSSKDLRLYDPYYCNGSVIENLAALGFPSVYNRNEDCYEVWTTMNSDNSSYPDFDVFITNPPYSGDHIQKLMKHITSPSFGDRPWFLLMPDFVHKKDYFQSLTKARGIQPFYLVPKKRYVYLPPKDYRASKRSDVHKKSSPFNSMWYVWGGTRDMNERLIRLFQNKTCTYPVLEAKSSSQERQEDLQRLKLSDACDLARSKSALRDLRRKVKKK